MRSENSSKNAVVSLIYYFINSIFSFVSKTVFIQYLGIEYSGLNSLFTNILGVLNIAELGLSTAIGYSLYKPLSENNTKEINEILKLYKYFYRIVAIFILVIGLILVLFLQNMVNTSINIIEIRIAFLLYLIATVTSYLFTFLNVLPSADQKNYLIVKIQGNFKIIKNILQLLAVALLKQYYVWLILEIFINILSYVYTNYIIKKKYAYYDSEIKKDFKSLIKEYKNIIIKIKDLFFHKIGGLVVNQTDNIVISYFCTLTDVGMYGNYMVIYTMITGCIDQMFMGITASIGSLVIEKTKKEVYNIWKEMHIITIFVATILCFLFYHLANTFITVWVGEEYMLNNVIVFCISLNIMAKIIKAPIERVKEAYGLFWDKQAPFIEAIINLIISIYFASKIGILGVVIGTAVSNVLSIFLWKPFIVFKYCFNEKFKNYYKITLKYVVLATISICISFFILEKLTIFKETNFVQLICKGTIELVVTGMVSLIVFMTTKTFRNTLNKYVRSIVIMIKDNSKGGI